LRERYCQGGVEQWSGKEQQAAEQIFNILKTLSNGKLSGKAETLPSGTFWTGQ
jgi:NitT/TauT family transport system substrate-binding protein